MSRKKKKANHKNQYKVATARPPEKYHRNLSLPVREDIHKLRALGWSYNNIAHELGISYGTVEYHLTKAKTAPDVIKAARAKAYEQMAGEITEKARGALDKITPDSLTHDRVVQYGPDGEIKSVQHSGPTGQQIAITAGILLDHANKLQDRADFINDGGAQGALNPGDLKALLDSVGGSIKKLQVLNIDIDGLRGMEAQFDTLSQQIEAEYEIVEDEESDELESGG